MSPVILLALAAVILYPPAIAATDLATNGRWCDSELLALQQPYEQAVTPEYPELLQLVQQLSKKCAGTGIYEARLAAIHLRLGQPGEARRALSSVTDPNLLQYPLVKAAAIQTATSELLLKDIKTAEELRNLESAHLDLVKAAPDWYVAYELAAHYELFLNDYEKAITLALKGIELESNSWLSYRTLAVAYAGKKNHLDAAKAGDKAYSLRKAMSGDPEFMLSLAESYAAMGATEMSKTLLSLLLHHRPDVRSTDEYVETLRLVKNEMQTRGVK